MPPQTTRIATYVTSDTRKLRRAVVNLTTGDFGQWWLRAECTATSAALANELGNAQLPTPSSFAIVDLLASTTGYLQRDAFADNNSDEIEWLEIVPPPSRAQPYNYSNGLLLTHSFTASEMTLSTLVWETKEEEEDIIRSGRLQLLPCATGFGAGETAHIYRTALHVS